MEYIKQNGSFAAEQMQALESAGAVGSIILNFVSSVGKKVETEMTRRIISADIVKAAYNGKEIIAFAEGKQKLPVIRAALEGKLISAFITSEETALELLR